MLYGIDKLKLHTYTYIYLFIINFSPKDRGHTKGEPVLGVPPYTHSYIHTHGQNTEKQAKTICDWICQNPAQSRKN